LAEPNHWSECGRATSLDNADALDSPHRSVLSLGGATFAMNKFLGILAALALPFFAVLAIGMVFDKTTGGDPMYTTTATLFFLSPLWLLLGIVGAVYAFRNNRFRRGLFVTDAILFLFIFACVALIRSHNAY
jgi:hypothetical protein